MATQTNCCTESGVRAHNTGSKRVRRTEHPDHSAHILKLNRMIGQVAGVKRMIEERRYCPDILIQTRAVSAALKAIEMGILETHLRHCVSEALNFPNPRKSSAKVEELVKVVGRF